MNNFSGVTFAAQKVTPSDDAIIRRAILPDGWLYGCDITYSGATLTMAAGALMACGRMIRHPSSQNWSIVDATSGYARLLITIDLTKTSTKDTFEQVVDSIEYATSKDGFVEPEQSDVNTYGTRYQVVACVVSLGPGGITGIVSQLGRSAVDGSGGLNFSLVGGETRPSDPAENTIWVNTAEEITGFSFSATKPSEPVEGMVWIVTGASSTVGFNALKKDGIQVYPLSAQQYVDGAWVSVNAESYQAGEWRSWIVYAYNHGDTCDSVHGGWTASTRWYKTNAQTPKITFNATSMTIDITVTNDGNWRSGIAETKNGIDLTPFSTMTFDITGLTANQAFDGNWTDALVGVTKTMTGTITTMAAEVRTNKTGKYTLDISKLEGIHDIVIKIVAQGTLNSYTRMTISEIKLSA